MHPLVPIAGYRPTRAQRRERRAQLRERLARDLAALDAADQQPITSWRERYPAVYAWLSQPSPGVREE